MVRIAEILALIAVFLLALVMAPLALGVGVLWFVGRLLLYAGARRGSAEIIGWVGQGDAALIEEAKAFPRLTFTGHDGATRVFTSRMGFNIYDDPPPTGAQPIRYHLLPRFYAEIDDKAHWFTGPALAVAAALLGSFLAGVWRSTLGVWF
jgi:hypothetical protein